MDAAEGTPEVAELEVLAILAERHAPRVRQSRREEDMTTLRPIKDQESHRAY